MPNFAEGVVESVKQIRLAMPEFKKPKPKPEEKKPEFVSEKAKHDCILHAVRDQRANVFWQAVESMSDAIADTMPLAFIPFTTRSPSGHPKNPDGWGGRWPVGMLGVSFSEADQILSFAKSFPQWEEDYPPIVTRILSYKTLADLNIGPNRVIDDSQTTKPLGVFIDEPRFDESQAIQFDEFKFLKSTKNRKQE